MVNIKTLKELARIEVENIKQHATKKEISKLNIETFDPNDHGECIYGQMTGSCNSKRAMNLIIECCNKVLSTEGMDENILDRCILNGEPRKLEDFNDRIDYYVSPVESLIYRQKTAGPKIIKYLKGETETLKL